MSSAARRLNRRQVAAAATRQEILLAARRLFAARGYSKTSIAEIAEAAGVSIPTIYASVGRKAAIVLALVNLVDAEIGAEYGRDRAGAATDPAALVALGARITRLLEERFGDLVGALRSAAETEPEVSGAAARADKLHRVGSARLARRLRALHALRPGVSVAEASAIISLLTEGATYRQLVEAYGWTFDRAEAWITSSLRTLLLK